MADNNTNIPAELLTAASNNQLIPIIGAGVSMSIKDQAGNKVFPSWQELLLNAASEAEKHSINHGTLIKTFVNMNNWQEAAKYAEQGLAGERWHQFLQNQFDIDHTTLDSQSADLPTAIWQLSNQIISLNYDKIQHHFSATPANVTAFDNSNNKQLSDFGDLNRSNHKQYIWHLHGQIDNPEHIVLTPLSYQTLYQQHQYPQAAIEKLKGLVSSHRLLFIGCSLDDAELLTEIAKQQQLFGQGSKRHFALVHQEKIQDIKQKLGNINIELIPFEAFGQPLVNLITTISAKPKTPETPKVQIKEKKIEQEQQNKSEESTDNNPILLLTANPLDWVQQNQTYDFERYNILLKELGKSPYPITHKPLTYDNLLTADEYPYTIIATRVEQQNLIIESEYLHSEAIELTEALEHLTDSSGVFCILAGSEGEIDLQTIENLATPLVIAKHQDTKTFISTFNSLWLKRFNDKFFNKNGIQVFNQSHFKTLDQTLKSNVGIKQHTSQLPSLINVNNLKNFIGRQTPLKDLAELLVEQNHQHIITIKGQGGMGKTTLAKKLATALARHNIYPQGIDFIDCESITDHNDFIRQIAASFGLMQAQNPFEQIVKIGPQHKLLILDNFETVLNLNEEQKHPIGEALKTLYPRVNILITSRQGLNNDIEQLYEIDQLIATEAQKLFINLCGNKIKDLSDKKLLAQIVDQQLNHNPLAITLISQNIIAGTTIEHLHEQLNQNPFAQLKQAEIKQFDSDNNKQRLQSVYNSIMYSYQNLKHNEKRTLELLSLFPDGLAFDTFERFVKEAKLEQRKDKQQQQQQKPAPTLTKSDITRDAIRSLTNKSLVENNQGHIALQSLIGKFAEIQLQQQPNRNRYYQQLLNQMQTFVTGLTEEYNRNEISALTTFNHQYNNILKAISAYSILNPEFYNGKPHFNANQQMQFDQLLLNTYTLAQRACNQQGFINALQPLTKHISRPLSETFFTDSSTALIQALLLSTRYYHGDFKASFNQLQQSLPLVAIEKLSQHKSLDINQRQIIFISTNIYSMEGRALAAAQINQQIQYYGHNYSSELFNLGQYHPDLAGICHLAHSDLVSLSVKAFFIKSTQPDTKVANEEIIDLVNQTLATLAPSNHMERIQVLYLKSQYQALPIKQINALVEVNPFTTGLKQLMLAFNLSQDQLYLQAIDNLEHIKYHWVEAKWHYCKFLIKTEATQNEIATQLDHGKTLSKQYHYRYLQYRFESLEAELSGEPIPPYNSDNYPLPGNPDFTPLIQGNLKAAKWHIKKYKRF